jgi:hypothetical protein
MQLDDNTLVCRYLAATIDHRMTQTAAAERIGKGQTTISDWKAKRDAGTTIEIREGKVREAIKAYLLQPERPAFREGVEYAVGEFRQLLEDIERRAAQVPADLAHEHEPRPGQTRRGGGKPSRRRTGDDPEQKPE